MRLRLIHSFLQRLISRYSSLLPFRVSPFAHCRVRTSRPELITSSNFTLLSSSHSSDLLGPHISSGVGICMHTIQFCELNICLPFNLFGTLKIWVSSPPLGLFIFLLTKYHTDNKKILFLPLRFYTITIEVFFSKT